MKQSTLHPQSNGLGLLEQQEAFLELHGLGTILLRPAVRIIPPYSWIGHLPFAHALIHLQKPRVLVELGTHIGNSFCGFCQAVKLERLDTRCYAVDTWRGDANAGYYGESVYQDLESYVESNYGNYASLLRMTFDQALEQFPDESVDLLHIDGLHTYDAVKHDFESWKVKLSPRAVVLFHDTQVFDRGFGVNKFWSELREQYAGYEFLHSHGLGILLVGAEVVPAVAKFVELSNANPEPIQTTFELASRLGLAGEALSYQKRFGSAGATEDVPVALYCELFLDYGQGFSENLKLIANLSLTEGCGQAVFELYQHATDLVRVRFDPGVDAIAMRKLKAQGRRCDGQWQPLEPVSDNVILHEVGFTLFPADPWVEYAVPAEGLNAIELNLEVEAMGIGLVDPLIERMCHITALEHEVKNLLVDLSENDRLLQESTKQQAELEVSLIDVHTEKNRLVQESTKRQAELEASLIDAHLELRRLAGNPLYRLFTLLRLLPRLTTNSGNQ